MSVSKNTSGLPPITREENTFPLVHFFLWGGKSNNQWKNNRVNPDANAGKSVALPQKMGGFTAGDLPSSTAKKPAADTVMLHFLGQSGWEARDFYGCIISVTVSKSVAGGEGTFEIVMKPYAPHAPGTALSDFVEDYESPSWNNALTDGDWVCIDVIKEGVAGHLMRGRVDTISTTIGISDDGGPITQVVVSGRDTTSVPKDSRIYFNPYDVAMGSNALGVAMANHIELMSAIISGPAIEFVPQIPSIFTDDLTFGHSPAIPDRAFGQLGPTTWSDVLNIETYVTKVRGNIFAPTVMNAMDVSCWDMAVGYQNPILNELFIDTLESDTALVSSKAYLYFRERPFENVVEGTKSPWFQLYPVAIDTSEISQAQLQKGANRLNHIQIVCDVQQIDNTEMVAMVQPLANISEIGRWGLKHEQFHTSYFAENSPTASPNSGPTGPMWAKQANEWQDLLLSHHALNPYYLNGMISLPTIRWDVRVGRKIAVTGGPSPILPVFPGSDPLNGQDCKSAFTAYVEAVSWTIMVGDTIHLETQIQISRGYREDKRLPDLEKEINKWVTVQSLTQPKTVTLSVPSHSEMAVNSKHEITSAFA